MDIFDLPQEILSFVLACLEPRDLVHFGSTCHQAHAFINPQNQLLWHAVFLGVFDDPHDAWNMLPPSAQPSRDSPFDWYTELRRRLGAINYIISGRYYSFLKDDMAHAAALVDIINTAKFGPNESDTARGIRPQVDDRSGRNVAILDKLYHHHPVGVEHLIHDSRRTEETTQDSDSPQNGTSPGRPVTRSMTANNEHLDRPEAASRLHVFYGLTNRERSSPKFRGASRRLVYNWNLSNDDNEYGPFYPNTCDVNWPRLEAVCSVMGRVFQVCTDGQLSMPSGLCYSIPYRTLIDPNAPDDWARVTGNWLGTYAFLDYAHLFAFNTWHYPRPSLDDEPEACGDLMRLELQVDHSEETQRDRKLQTSLPICEDLPLLRFSGTSRGNLDQLFVRVRGFAHLIPGGRQVRWRFIISYGGADQWQLEGVQPGGIRSGGIYGLWSQCDHDENGPVGPFCYFPMELCKPTSLVVSTTPQ